MIDEVFGNVISGFVNDQVDMKSEVFFNYSLFSETKTLNYKEIINLVRFTTRMNACSILKYENMSIGHMLWV